MEGQSWWRQRIIDKSSTCFHLPATSGKEKGTKRPKFSQLLSVWASFIFPGHKVFVNNHPISYDHTYFILKSGGWVKHSILWSWEIFKDWALKTILADLVKEGGKRNSARKSCLIVLHCRKNDKFIKHWNWTTAIVRSILRQCQQATCTFTMRK